MRRAAGLFSLGAATLLLGGCFSLTDKQAPEIKVPDTAAAVQANTQQKAEQKKPTFTMPDTLGGVVSSDSWIVHQDTHEEEFQGNVKYDSDVYVFRAGYVLSQRDKNKISAQNSMYVRKNEPDGSWYELYADNVSYNYQTGKGRAQAAGNKRVKVIYTNAQKEVITAWAKRIDFDTETEIYELTGRAEIQQKDLQGQVNTLRANRILARQKDQYALLQGKAQASNNDYTLHAHMMEYDGVSRQARAAGDRPLAQGNTDNGTFAIIADEVQADTTTHNLHLQGQVQGWVVSDAISSSAANKNF